MATVTAKHVWPGENRIQFHASWEDYQAVARAIGDQQVRIAFDGERLELMSPGPAHEIFKELAAYLVRTLATELNLPTMGTGSTRWERPEAERAIEADATFYLTSEKIAIAVRRPNLASEYPVPDLAIEIDLRPSKIDRESIYQALRVPEVWRFDGETLRIDRLQSDGSYDDASESGFFGARADEIARLLLVEAADDADFGRQATEWIREVLIPRRLT
jgi:Uma2 family endonuclease